LNALITFFHNNGTKILAGLIGTLGIIQATAGIVPPSADKYLTLVIAILVYWRGMANTQNIATIVSQQHATAIATAAATGTAPVLAPAGQLAPVPKVSPSFTKAS
jgi:hypothetical protein